MTYELGVDGKDIPFVQGVTYEWQVKGGVLAPLQGWVLPSHVVNQLVRDKAGQEIKLRLGDLDIERVILLGNGPTGDVQTQMLLFADVRWYFTREWFVRDFNRRRRTGDKRVVGNNAPQAANVVADIAYAPWALNAGTAWMWEAAKKDVLDAATSVRPTRPEIKWVQDPTKFNIADRIVEETFIDDFLPVGIAKALASIPGRDLYVDLKGVVHVYDRIPGAEIEFVQSLPDLLENEGSWELVDMSATRPKGGYRTLMDPEIEIRVDVGSTTDVNGPFAENVLRLPDVTTEIPAGSGRAARTVGQGTITTHAEAYTAWGAGVSANGSAAPQLSDDIVRRHWLGLNVLRTCYAFRGDGVYDPQWTARIDEVHGTYRIFFRINPRFWQAVASARPVMAAIWDTETGTRADSPVYCDYAIFPPVPADDVTLSQASNITSWAALLVNARRAPARVRIVDMEQGLFVIEWQRDSTGVYAEIAPSAVTALPTSEVQSDGRPIPFHSCQLTDVNTFKLSTVLSCVPGAPNDLRRLYAVPTTLEDAAARLGLTGVNLEAKGPAFDLRSKLTTARFAWQDDDGVRNQLYEFFGLFTKQPPNPAAPPVPTIVPVNEEEVKAVAASTAAADLINRLDHIEGTFGVPLTGGITPLGTIAMVVHQVTENSAVTKMQAVAPSIPPDPVATLPASVRKILAREVQP